RINDSRQPVERATEDGLSPTPAGLCQLTAVFPGDTAGVNSTDESSQRRIAGNIRSLASVQSQESRRSAESYRSSTLRLRLTRLFNHSHRNGSSPLSFFGVLALALAALRYE
ncbi:MAG: hypothetical protein ACRD63_18125, partial [Pyrinomonadaceae bacterium]